MTDTNPSNITEAIKSDLTSISSDIAEAGFDQLLSDGFLKELPVIGSGFKMLGIARKILDAIFLKNIFKFLYQLKDIPLNQGSIYRKAGG